MSILILYEYHTFYNTTKKIYFFLVFLHRMWKADEYLKKGREIQMIYDKEEDILKKLQTIKRNTSKYAKFETSASYINEINKSIGGTLNQIGTLVDDAQMVLSDKSTRMTTEGRRDILKETLSKLIIIAKFL